MEMNIEHYLDAHLASHPEAEAQDVMKFCHQAFFGPGHMLEDENWARIMFFEEYGISRSGGRVLYENLSDRFCRVDLSAWKEMGFDGELLFSIFSASCTVGAAGMEYPFMQLLSGCSQTIRTKHPHLYHPWMDYLDSYLGQGVRPVRHSIRYRNAYTPAYRVVERALLLEKMTAVRGS